MNNVCYTLVIKQITCQNGVAKRIDNAYTNIKPGTQIPLSFGYTLTYTSGNANNAFVTLTNPIFIPSISFSIPNEGNRIFDLPFEGGTFRVFIAARCVPCVTCCRTLN